MTTSALVRQILPKNVTTLERTATEVLLERLDDLPILFDSIWNPETCPERLLPFLAWALSVDVWNDAWPISAKRATISAAPKVHRRKGTLWALETILAAIAIDIRLVEWWQAVPERRRGTFDLEAYFNDHRDFGSEVRQADFMRILRATKPKSRPATVRLGLVTGSGLVMAHGGHAAVRLAGRATARHVPRTCQARLGLVAGGVVGISITGTAIAARATGY